VKSNVEISDVIEHLDPLETMHYNHFIKQSTPEQTLHLIANSAEGDESQLSPKLAQYAKQKGWLEGYEGDYWNAEAERDERMSKEERDEYAYRNDPRKR